MKPSSTEIENQVNNILASKDFQASAKLSEFLNFVVKETLKGNAVQLKGYTIATKVLGRGIDFDQSKDPIVRILAGRLRRTLERYYHTEGKSAPVYINIPVGSYIPEFKFKVNGTDDRIKEYPVSQSSNFDEQERLIIAVLPFKDLNNNNETLFAGLAKNIIVELSRYQLLEISAIKSNGDTTDNFIFDLYQRTGARFILEGCYKKEKNIIKIFTELIDLKLNEVIWIEKFDVTINQNNLFKVEEKISNKIASVIGSEYGIVSKDIENELKSKQYRYLHDYEFINGFYSVQHSFAKQAIKNFITATEKLLKVNPDKGILHTVVAGLSLFSYVLNIEWRNDSIEYSSDHLIKASDFESDNQMLRTVQSILYFTQNNKKLLIEEGEAAISLNPNSPYSLGVYGFFLVHIGEYDKGIQYLKKSMGINSNYPAWWNLAFAAFEYTNKEYENSYNESLKINLRDAFWAHIYTIASLGKLKKKDEAQLEIVKLKKLIPNFNRKGVGLLGRLIKDKNLLNNLIDGLNKAGLNIS